MANRAHKSRARSKPKNLHKREHKHYFPYLPVLLIIAIFGVSLLQPLRAMGVLSYSTEMSRSQLLVSTNNRRSANGVGSLILNSKLNNAAQAKANDMVERNYWSHNTPDGEEPWIFFDAANYLYLKAGENLAYGFSSSDSTVTGWMNSPTHRDNLLDVAFSEVGFGYANSQNFNDSGPQTIVVAMYGKPQVLSENNSQQESTKPTQSAEVVPEAELEPTPVPSEQIEEKQEESTETPSQESVPVNSDTELDTEPASQTVTRVETLGGGNKPWLLFVVGLITGGLTMFLLVKHAVRLRHLVRNSEKFILHHPLLDSVVLGIILIGTILLQTSGVIR